MPELADPQIYLQRLSLPLQEKLRVARYIHRGAQNILDVGCADGAVTLALAQLFPQAQFLGIDLDESFIALANRKARQQNLANVRFRRVFLRDLLAETPRYDALLFISVLHEFFTYGQGLSSVLKALSDAQELLQPGGDIVIRDMILLQYTKSTTWLAASALQKIRAQPPLVERLNDFEKCFGPARSIYALNHFLLKYPYTENWSRECPEHYVPVTFEQYENIFTLLGMELILRDAHLLPWLRQKWQADFDFTDDELAPLASTGLLVARKPQRQ